MNIKNYKTRMAKSLFAIDYLGRYCKDCNFDGFKEPWFMDFHHKNPKDKNYDVKNKVYIGSFSKIKEEIDKCELLCSQCHKKRHSYFTDYEKNKKEIFEIFREIKDNSGELRNQPKRFSIEDLNLINQLLDDNKTIKEISEKLGRQRRVISEKIKELNKFPKRDVLINNIDTESFIKMFNEGKSIREIARQFKIGHSSAEILAKKLNLSLKLRNDDLDKKIIDVYEEVKNLDKASIVLKLSKNKIKKVLKCNKIELGKSNRKLSYCDISRILDLKNKGKKDKEIASIFGVTRSTISRKIADAKNLTCGTKI